jgi:ribosomal protein L21E
MKGLYQNLGIEANPSTAYHPQTDGQTKWVNQELEEYLRIYVNERQNDWVDWLPIAQFCHNDRAHSATGFSPFMITTGRHPFKGIYTGKETTNQTAEKYIEKFKETWKTTEKNLEQAAERMKRQHDKHVKPSRQYQVGDQVYLDASKIKTTRASKKLDAKFHGPFKVISMVRKSAYKLELPPGWGIHDVFHESKLKPAHELQFPKQKETRPQPPLEIIDGNEEHEVEEVQGVRNKQGKKQFLVKWKGLPQEESSWEPEENLKNASGTIRDFFKRAITELDNNIPLPSPSPSLSPRLQDASPPIVPTPMVSSVRGEHLLISSLSTHHTHDYTDGAIRNSTKNTFTSWKKPGNAGRAHAKRLTQRRTAAEPSLHTHPLSQELPTYGESTTHCTPCKGVKS